MLAVLVVRRLGGGGRGGRWAASSRARGGSPAAHPESSSDPLTTDRRRRGSARPPRPAMSFQPLGPLRRRPPPTPMRRRSSPTAPRPAPRAVLPTLPWPRPAWEGPPTRNLRPHLGRPSGSPPPRPDSVGTNCELYGANQPKFNIPRSSTLINQFKRRKPLIRQSLRCGIGRSPRQKKKKSGLEKVEKLVKKVAGYGFCRHPRPVLPTFPAARLPPACVRKAGR